MADPDLDPVDYPIAPGTKVDAVAIEAGSVRQMVVSSDRYVPLGFDSAAVTTSASLPTIPATAQTAFVTVEGGDIRYRPDGASTAPTASVGMLVPDGATVELPFGQDGLVATRIILASGSPTISVVYA